MRYLFDEYALDVDRRELHRSQVVVPVAPQVFDLLEYLIRNSERVVSKDDLISAVWNGRIVSDAALTTRLNAARSAIGDTGERQRLIKTLPRKGFRFVGAVQETQSRTVEPVGSVAHSSDTTPSRPIAPRLSMVVLPFVNLSSDPQQDYFVDGVTESLTTDLSRISGSFVIGRHTAFAYKGKAVDLKQIGRDLNVRYVIEGSVQRGGNRFRVNVQLIDAETSKHLWAERFDKPVADLFDIQDEIVSRLANTLDAELIGAEARRAERSSSPDAMDLYFQGRALENRGTTPAFMAQAKSLFVRALSLDPTNLEAAVEAAQIDQIIGSAYMVDDRATHLASAERTIIKVLTLAPNHPKAHMVLGLVQMFTGRAAQGVASCERAISLDRNLAHAHAGIGLGKLFSGLGAETEAHLHTAMRLSPRDTNLHLWMLFIGLSKLALHLDVEAVAWLRRSLEANRNHPNTHFHFAAALGLNGDIEEARSAVEAGLELDPNFTIRRYRNNAPSDHPAYLAYRQHVYEGMRVAGVPAG
ncbi:TolB-like protein/Flp pilus assembly protein TadD [Bradyrhizobium niftali]|uniref:winged helix-turn-helix domain-containing protein n=1 Tax=Bradyrhizobium niftali TaxID=2560055 RepID=UPI0038396D16